MDSILCALKWRMATSFFAYPMQIGTYIKEMSRFFQNRHFRMKVDIFFKCKFIKMVCSLACTQ